MEIQTVHGPFAGIVAKERLRQHQQKEVGKRVDLMLENMHLEEKMKELEENVEKLKLEKMKLENWKKQHEKQHCCSSDKLNEKKQEILDTLTSKENKKKSQDTISNSVVLLICIAEFDKTKNLDAVKEDLAHFRKLFEEYYNYDVYPKKNGEFDKKFHWKKHDIMEFIEQYREKLFAKNKNHDSLIVIHRGHGAHGTILTSDHKEIDVVTLNNKVGDAWKYKSVYIPRIFIVDAGCNEKKIDKSDNLITVYGNAYTNKCATWQDIKYGGFLSQAVIHALLNNVTKPKQIGELIADMASILKQIDGNSQIVFPSGDHNLNKIWIKPNK